MVYPDQENPRSRQLPPRIVCRFLPCWYQGEIRVPASFRCDRDQLIFLGLRRSEGSPLEPDGKAMTSTWKYRQKGSGILRIMARTLQGMASERAIRWAESYRMSCVAQRFAEFRVILEIAICPVR